ALTYSNQIVFTSSRTKSTWITKKHGWTEKQYYNSYSTHKDETGNYVKPKQFLKGINSKFNDGPISITKDGNTIFFTRNAIEKENKSSDGTYKLNIYQGTISLGTIVQPLLLKFNNKEFNCAHPSISEDGKTLYFASDMPGGFGGMDIFYSEMGSDGVWGTPINMGEKINTKGHDMFPFITKENVLYFSSDGHEGLGGLDIYEAPLKDKKANRVYNMGMPINSQMDDFGYYLNEDLKSGFLSSNRTNGGMNDDIFSVEILRKVVRGKLVTIIVKDKDSGEKLSGASLKINEETFTTDENGAYIHLIEEDNNYIINASKADYFDNSDSVTTKSSEEDEFTKEISLEKDPKLSFFAVITDAKENKPLDSVKVVVRDLFTKEVFDSTTASTVGEYKKSLKDRKIGDKVAYEITLSRNGFLTKKVNYTAEIKEQGVINLHEILNMKLGRVQVGMDLAKMIDLKPIYFDLGKYKIRKDAETELDKIVEVMNKYPNMYIELGSHSDCRGSAKSNLSLSDKRAKASAAYIVKKGIAKDRIVGKGYGESKLLNGCACEGKVKPNCSEEEHSVNRRTEFIITKMK
ncbi:MAG: OmpA family protein, partial [Bacteroidia bacterium]